MMEYRIGNRDVGKGSDLIPREGELALGRQLGAHVEQQGKIDDDPVVSACHIGQALACHQQLDAVALPGGLVLIYTDLRLKANDEAEAEVAC